MGNFRPAQHFKIVPELTPYIIGLPAVIEEFVSIAGAKYIGGSYVVDCNAVIPDLRMKVVDEKGVITISADNLVIKKENECVLAFASQPSFGFGPDMYFGAPLFKQYCIGIDFPLSIVVIRPLSSPTTTTTVNPR
ncbi:unnamed protein product [Cylicostephanus goldi]|uniref:Peptidase A1 domain-containing protein n=1 Tax=Cylicostephanus goldi TaxID=71465 RepID=A0A3P7N4A8_CYLGO|nr:unnamed protein product [Cylicostephanus goldi]